MSRQIHGVLLAILMLAAALRFVGLDHGLPRNYVPDTTVVRAALSLGAGTQPFLGDPLPTQYPYLLPYALFAVYGTIYLAGNLTGVFEGPDDFEALAIEHPELFFLIARVVIALSGTLMVLLVVLVGWRLTNPPGALAAGMFTATSLILVQLSHQARPHIISATFLVACLWLALRWEERNRRRDLFGSWLTAGFAAATVPYGLMGVLIPMVATWRGAGGRVESRRSRWWLTGIGLCLVSVVMLVCYPQIVLRPTGTFGYDEGSGIVRHFGGLLVSPRFVNGQGFAKLAKWLFCYESVLVLFALAASVGIVRSRPERKRWILAMVFPALFALIYGSYEVIHPRYIVPLVPFLALLAGSCFGNLIVRLRTRGPWVPGIVGVVVFAIPLTQALRLDLLLSREDTRLLAEGWIATHLSQEDGLGIEAHGVMPPADLESLERMEERFPGRLGTKDQRRLARKKAADGRRLSRLWYRERYRQETVAEVVSQEQIRYVAVVVDSRVRDDIFYRSLSSGATLLAEFSPTSLPRNDVETRLPLELENPLIGLWRVERCGPTVEIYEVSP